MSWSTVRPQLKTLLDTIGDLQEVSATPKLKFSGYPAAYIIPSDNEGDYETTTENVRTYAFNIRLFYETKSTGIASALDKLDGIVDTVLDTLDQEDLKSATSRTVGVNLPSGYTYLNIFAMPSVWGQVDGEELLMAEIKVRIRISIDIT